MKPQFKAALLLLLVPTLLFANNKKPVVKQTREKTYHKEYSVKPDAKLEVSNSFGNIDIVTWNENRIVIDVVVSVKGNDSEKIQKRLDRIDVIFTTTNSLVTAKTKFSKKKSSWNWFGSNDNSSMEINYTIKMPITNSVDLNNDYGAINISELEGHAKISCDYGQLIIGALKADDNLLYFDYTSKSTIGYMKSGKINADYSGFTLDKVEQLELNADYTSSEILDVNTINYNCDYGEIKIDKAKTLVGTGDYISHKIGEITETLAINADYGAIKINRIAPTAKSAKINADYTSIKLGYDSDLNFNFFIKLDYASLTGESNLTVKHKLIENGSKSYTGYYGSENTANTITINSEYGGVTLIKN